MGIRTLSLTSPTMALALLCCACGAAPDAALSGLSVHDPDDRAAAVSRGVAETGPPAPLDAAQLEALRTVRTEPGELPRLKLRHGGKLYDLPLTDTAVEVDIVGHVARVEVRQQYRNPFREPIETVYAFPLPENSAVTDLRFEIGDRVVQSELKRRAEARKTYEAARASGYTAALLEQERPNGFTQSVANIPPESEIDVVIRYVQDLTYDANTYEFVFPMVIGPRYTPGRPLMRPPSGGGSSPDTDAVPDASRLSPAVVGGGTRTGNDMHIRVRAEVGQPIVGWSVPTHTVSGGHAGGRLDVRLIEGDRLPNRDFVLRFEVGGEQPQAALLAHRSPAGGWFSLLVHPPTLDLDRLVGQRELVFVLDVSGSMRGVPIAMSKRAIELALRRLRPADTFNIITFAGGTAQLFPAARAVNTATVQQALKWVDRLMAGGGTRMADAIDVALGADISPGRDRHVVFLTDGYVSNEGAIMQKTQAYTRARLERGERGRVFGFGVGSSVNRCLLNGLAAQGRGTTMYATTREDPAVAVDRFFALVDQPVLTDVSIDWGGLPVQDVTPTRLPDLFASRPLIVHGRFDGAGQGTATVRGRLGGRAIELPVAVDFGQAPTGNDVLAALWARARIDALGTRLWNTVEPSQTVIDRIVELSLAHRVMTPYTSFVAVDRTRAIEGPARRIDVPVEAPEGVDPEAAGARVLAGEMDGDDPDGDGLPTHRDVCPEVPEDHDGFEDADGCPEPDNDADGIPDVEDQCPVEPEVFNGQDDQDGCPDAGRVLLVLDRIEILEKVFFEAGSARIHPRSFALLDEVAQVLQRVPGIRKVEIEGHTDSSGAATGNMRISEKRARAVMRALVVRGVEPQRLSAKGYGETRPIDTNQTREGRARNRRVEFRIVEGQPRPAPYTAPPPPTPIEPHLVTCTGTWISPAAPIDSARVEVIEPGDVDPWWLGAHLADARACYDLALLTAPDLQGDVRVRYGADGAVQVDGVEHPEFVRCLAESSAVRRRGVAGALRLRLSR